MAKQFYLPKADADRALWLQNFATKLPGYMGTFGVLQTEVDDMTFGSVDFNYRLNASNQWHAYATKWTAYKNELRDSNSSATATEQPSLPQLPGVPPSVAPGLFSRVAGIVNRIKSHTAYTEATGRDLGIIGTESVTDYSTLKPNVGIRTGSGGVPEIIWDKQGMDGVAIYKDSGSGFTFYDLDNHPNYQDKHPLPAGGQSAVWKYKVIYRQNDTEAGQWSDILTMTVGG